MTYLAAWQATADNSVEFHHNFSDVLFLFLHFCVSQRLGSAGLVLIIFDRVPNDLGIRSLLHDGQIFEIVLIFCST